MISFYFVCDPSEFCYSFRSRANLEPLSLPLQLGIRFFTHPLPSRGFGFDYSWLTKKFRPLFPRLCRVFPVVSTEVFEVVRMTTFSAGDYVSTFLRNENLRTTLPMPFWHRLIRSNLACFTMTQFNQQLRPCSSFFFSLLLLTS